MGFIHQQFGDNFQLLPLSAAIWCIISWLYPAAWVWCGYCGWRVVASLMQLTAIVTANNTNTVCLSTVNCFLFSNCIFGCVMCADCGLLCDGNIIHWVWRAGTAGGRGKQNIFSDSLDIIVVILDNWEVEWEADDGCIWRHLGREPRQARVQLPTLRPGHRPPQVEMLWALRHRRCQGISLFRI